jgi:hypothetical protein
MELFSAISLTGISFEDDDDIRLLSIFMAVNAGKKSNVRLEGSWNNYLLRVIIWLL